MGELFGLNIDRDMSTNGDSLGLGGVDSNIGAGDSYQGLASFMSMNSSDSSGGNFYDAQQWDSTATKESSAGYGATAISAIGTVASTLISVAAKKDAMKQQTKEITASMKATVQEYEFMASVNEQQMDAVDRVVGNKMSETGLKRLKDKASLRAAAAMSGTVGGTTNAVIQEASIIEMMDNAVIIANGRQEKAALGQKIQGQYLSAQNRINNLAAGIQSSTGAGLQMIDAGLQGFSKAYMSLPASERRKYFGYTVDN